jgi:hypothetical protein
MRKATSQSQEMEYRACSTLRPRPSFLKCYESMCKPSGHQLINNNDTRSESLLRQRHFKSRKGCHSCKARRVKVLYFNTTSRDGKLSYITLL